MSEVIFPNHFESLYPADSRSSEIDRMLSYIKEGNSCQVIGLPGTGRSNLLRFLPYNKAIRTKHLGENRKWFHFVPVNFPEIRRRPLYDFTKFLFLALLDSVRERRMDEAYQKLNNIFKESLAFQDELVLFQGLKRAIDLLAIDKELTIVLLFDRFEEYIPMLTPDFFSNLQVLRSRAKYRFSVVFSLNRPLEDSVEPALFADFYEFMAGNIILLPITDKPGMDFRLAYLQKVAEKKLSPQLIEKVLDITGGHMKLARLSFEALLSSDAPFDTTSSLEQFLLSKKTVKAALYEIWNYLLPSEQEHFVEEKELSKEDQATHDLLQKLGLLRDGKLTILLLKDFIEKKQLEQEVEEDKITLDPITNDLMKGYINLSEKLTAAEHRLLLHILQNKERVIEREEIINSVWFDSKSTAGVTDQALDQLIFRVRRKIENDPNNPTHILTVKGRGIRFLP